MKQFCTIPFEVFEPPTAVSSKLFLQKSVHKPEIPFRLLEECSSSLIEFDFLFQESLDCKFELFKFDLNLTKKVKSK
jgi:hypothetical protein